MANKMILLAILPSVILVLLSVLIRNPLSLSILFPSVEDKTLPSAF